ncbi:MAG: leucine-rich repeat protein [Clostridium sp.]|nr:leucine-rich repeat protein [Clostridium sp.]
MMRSSLSTFLKKLATLFVLSIIIQINAYADYVRTGNLNGVYFKLYYYSYSDNVAMVIAPPNGVKYAGDITVDTDIKIGSISYEVRGFESGAFMDQDEMVSLTCPITHGNAPSPSEFEGCTKLENLKLFTRDYSEYVTYGGALYEKLQNSNYALAICPPAITTLDVYFSTDGVIINSRSFVSTNNLKKINLSYNASISGGWGQFPNFESFNASSSVKYISSDGVLYTKDKKTLKAMPGRPRDEYKPLAETTTIGNSSFESCHIDNLYLDDKSFTIYPAAFSNFSGNLHLSGLSSLTKESNVTYLDGPCYFTEFCGNLILEGEVSQGLASHLSELNDDATISCEGKYIDLIRKYWNGNIVSTTPCWIKEREAGYASVLFSLDSDNESILENAKVYFKGLQISPNNGKYEINGLIPDSSYNIEIHYLDTDGNEAVIIDSIETQSVSAKYKMEILSTTQTSAICKLYVPKDILNLGLKGGVCTTNPSNIPNEEDDNESIITVTELDENNIINYNNNQGVMTIEIKGLTPDIIHEFTPIIANNNDQVRYNHHASSCRTAPLNLSVSFSELTQLSFKISSISNSGLLNCADWLIKTNDDNGELVPIEGYGKNYLYPGTEYYIPLYFEKDRVKFISGIWVKTAPMNFNVEFSNITPTTAKIDASYSNGNAVEYIKSINFTILNNNYENTVELTGLKPNTTYSVSMSVLMIFENDGSTSRKTYSATRDFTTKELLLTTLTPNCVNSSTANVRAETNIVYPESGAGFQWKKYDAPSSLPPNEGYGFARKGVLEGQIKNLQSTSYYNVRAFYKSADGTYYYGDWITFDPSDFSYFDPTVYSFDKPDIIQNSVILHGYALGGSDEILSQGFQYWNNQDISRSVGNVMTVHASGQLMQASLSDHPNGNYSYRAYVETLHGFYYGDEYCFSIETSVADSVQRDLETKNIVGFYNINGTRFDEPQKGVNIVLYNDGTSKKIVIR